jgi:hypothetical protein
MLRVGLVAYLMLWVMAGQSFCCCKTAPLLGGPSENMQSTDNQESSVQHESTCPCCANKEDATSKAEPAVNSCPGHPGKCHCSENKSATDFRLPGDSLQDLLKVQFGSSVEVAFLADSASVSTCKALHESILPGASGRDILLAHHILRC